jgi:DNA-binding response OmpR family regulator
MHVHFNFSGGMKTKILYVEDEPFLGRIVKETLEGKGFTVLLVNDGAQVMQSFKTFSPDVCVLDVMLPNMDGFTLGRNIRNISSHTPIIFLTAKTQTEDIVKGFGSGGTDYIRKPFSAEELVIRIQNQLQLTGGKLAGDRTKPEKVALGKFSFYPGKYELHYKDDVVRLSNRESQVLSLLTARLNHTVDRKDLLLSVWGDDSFFNSRNLDVYIRRLRDYFSKDKNIEIITLKGKGYCFAVVGK